MRVAGKPSGTMAGHRRAKARRWQDGLPDHSARLRPRPSFSARSELAGSEAANLRTCSSPVPPYSYGFAPPKARVRPDTEEGIMVKPRSGDRKISLLIAGEELSELKEWSWAMGEAFGLDRKIERYQGKRPIGLYRWDCDCLLAVMDSALKDNKRYPDKSASRYQSLASLNARLIDEYRKTYE